MNWEDLITSEIKKEYFKNIKIQLLNDNNLGKKIYPHPANYFKALKLCDYVNLKIVILGQDPYHSEGVADGLAFSSAKNLIIPPSLKNIFKEIESDIGIKNTSSNLNEWAKRGVLLLNSSLSVIQGKPLSHSKIGWETFTDKVIHEASKKKNIVFMLWGNYTKSQRKFIESGNLILEAAHPSPLSAHNGFFGCKHFSQANSFLAQKNIKAVDWQLS